MYSYWNMKNIIWCVITWYRQIMKVNSTAHSKYICKIFDGSHDQISVGCLVTIFTALTLQITDLDTILMLWIYVTWVSKCKRQEEKKHCDRLTSITGVSYTCRELYVKTKSNYSTNQCHDTDKVQNSICPVTFPTQSYWTCQDQRPDWCWL